MWDNFVGSIKMAERPNTSPIGQDGASQWHRNVFFDPNLFQAQPRYFVFLDGIFS